MIVDMTRQKRLRKTLAFAYVMLVLDMAGFAALPDMISVAGAALAVQGVIWALFGSSIATELARLRLVIDTKGGAIDENN